jgi:uncharacterized membrane protein YdjX (TVP38/TMEM64 family)
MTLPKFSHKPFFHKSSSQRFLFCLFLGLACVSLLLSLHRFSFRGLLDYQFWVDYYSGLGTWATIVFLISYIIATASGIPGIPLTIAGGAIFGLGWGSLWSVLGATLGAIVAFLLARFWLRHRLEQIWGAHPLLCRFDRAIAHKPLHFILAIRFAPISPFNLVNFLLGLTQVDLQSYALGTLIGIIPGTVVYTGLGAAGVEALRGGTKLYVVIALSLLCILSLLPMGFKRIGLKRGFKSSFLEPKP